MRIAIAAVATAGMLVASSLSLAAGGDDPLGIGGMIEALVLSEFSAVEQIEIPTLARFSSGVSGDELDEIQIDVSPTGPLRGDRLGLRVATSRDGRVLKRGVLTVRVQGMRDVVVAKRNLRVRERISDADVELIPRPLAELKADALTDLDAVVGKRAKRSLRKGHSVRSGSIEISPDVVRGQRVKVQVRSGGLRIDTVGEAKQDGRKGEWIRILNQSSRREILGRVHGEGVVHVDL